MKQQPRLHVSDRPANGAVRHKDDSVIGQITTALLIAPAVLVAHEVGLFAALDAEPLTIDEVCAQFSLRPRAADALLLTALAAGLVVRQGDDRYLLSEVGADYLLRDSPTNWCAYLDYLLSDTRLFSYEGVREALLTDRPQARVDQELFEVHRQNDERAIKFTRWMHSVAVGPAGAWPREVDLTGARRLLDIGGGSGAHAIGVAQRWTALNVMLLDLPNVCTVADEYIGRAGLSARVSTRPTDMWDESYPAADVHFYSQVFHDWSPDECRELARKSFASLPSGGRIVIHELLVDDDKCGPPRAAAVNLLMSMLYARGRQYSGAEIGDILQDAGFTGMRWQHTFGHWGIVVADRP